MKSEAGVAGGLDSPPADTQRARQRISRGRLVLSTRGH